MNMGWAPRGRTPGGAGRLMNQNDQLTLMRDVRWHSQLEVLVSNPISELAELRNATVGSETNVALIPGKPYTLAGTAGGAAASADIVLNFTLPSSAVQLLGVAVLSGKALSWSTDDDGSGVDVLVNVSAAALDGTRAGWMSIGRRYGSCFWKDCCANLTTPDRGGGNCTARTSDSCDGPAVPCDGPGASDNTMCRFGRPSGNCGTGNFTVPAGVSQLDMRVLV
jgi:hypothetical protein